VVWGVGVCALLGLGVGDAAAQKRAGSSHDVGANELGPAVHKDLAYGRDKKFQRLNLSLPDRTDGPVPVVIWIHGGAWVLGDKDDPHPAESLVDEGFAVASIDYHPATQAAYPAQFEDCCAAVIWLRVNAKKYRIDPERVGVWGHSAGGHLAALLGVRSGGNNRAAVQAVCDWAGPVDLLEFIADSAPEHRAAASDMLWRLYLGPAADNLKLREGLTANKRRQLLQSGSPLASLKEQPPPFLVIHGVNDTIVPPVQSRRFVNRLQELKARVEYLPLPEVGHDPGENPVSMERTLQFFREHLGLPKKTAATDGSPRQQAED
jgi:acetyl esterase/lipase